MQYGAPATIEHVTSERERALYNRLSATAGTQSDRRGREKRENEPRGVRWRGGGWKGAGMGGSCSGGGTFISARGLHVIMIPFPMFESSLNLLSPRFFCALVFHAESLHYNNECSVLFLFQISYDYNSTQRFQLH